MTASSERSPAPAVRPTTAADRPWMAAVLRERWGSELVVSRGREQRPDRLEGLVAELDGKPSGLVTLRRDGDEVEVVTLDALVPHRGVGTALLAAASDSARRCGARRLWLVTSNDNLDAVRFYQRRGLRICAVHPGALDRARQRKPQIPAVGRDGIAVHDEVELELHLDDADITGAPTGQRPGPEPSAAVYGTLLAGGVLVAESSRRETLWEAVVAVAVTFALYWLAHAYARLLADRLERPRRWSAGHLWVIARAESPLLAAAVPPIAVLGLARAAGASESVAVSAAVAACVALLIGLEILAGARARVGPAERAVQVVLGALLGTGVLLLKVVLH